MDEHIVFLSHQTNDKRVVRETGRTLAENGIEPILDEWTFRRGRSLQAQIQDSIERSTAFVLFWSQSAASSKYVQFEDEIAVARRIKDETYLTHLVRLDETPIPKKHSFLLYHDWRRGRPGSQLFRDHLRVLTRSILGLPDTDPPNVDSRHATENRTRAGANVDTLNVNWCYMLGLHLSVWYFNSMALWMTVLGKRTAIKKGGAAAYKKFSQELTETTDASKKDVEMCLVNLEPGPTLLNFIRDRFPNPSSYGDEQQWNRIIQAVVVCLARNYSRECVGALKVSWYLHRFCTTADFYGESPSDIFPIFDNILNDRDCTFTDGVRNLLKRIKRSTKMSAIEDVVEKIDEQYNYDRLAKASV